MPELAEVEFYRRQWDEGVGHKISRIAFHENVRVFRGNDLDLLRQLKGKTLKASEAAAKQMLFTFSGDLWMGIHLGMSGRLSVAPPNWVPEKHDHLVLFQKERAFIYNDTRQFGRILIHKGVEAPEWWRSIAPPVGSKEFTPTLVNRFLKQHARLPIKSALLLQKGFPGIGNWMADEILWRAGIAPVKLCASLSPDGSRRIWREARFVAREALTRIGERSGEPPGNWLFHQRWTRGGICPRHKSLLRRDNVGGRTTAWCSKCQK
jgi:formamidopyrimidine-DNA glycosylase